MTATRPMKRPSYQPPADPWWLRPLTARVLCGHCGRTATLEECQVAGLDEPAGVMCPWCKGAIEVRDTTQRSLFDE